MNFDELQTELSEMLNFTDGTVDSNFTTAQLKRALNRAYTREVRIAKKEGSSLWFKVAQSETWPSDTLKFALPNGLDKKNILRIYDATDNDPGIPLDIGHQGNLGRVFWRDHKTLQWSNTTGPAEDKTLTFVYWADAAPMINENDQPFLVPPENRELIYVSAAVDLRLRADEEVPGHWMGMYRDLQHDYWKKVSQGRPADMPPTIRVVRAQDNTFVYYN